MIAPPSPARRAWPAPPGLRATVSSPAIASVAVSDPLAAVTSDLAAQFRAIKVPEDALLALASAGSAGSAVDSLDARIERLDALLARLDHILATAAAKHARQWRVTDHSDALPHRPSSAVDRGRDASPTTAAALNAVDGSDNRPSSSSVDEIPTATTAVTGPKRHHQHNPWFDKLVALREAVTVELGMYRELAHGSPEMLVANALQYSSDVDDESVLYNEPTPLLHPASPGALDAHSVAAPSLFALDPLDLMPLSHPLPSISMETADLCAEPMQWLPMPAVAALMRERELGLASCIHVPPSRNMLLVGTSRGCTLVLRVGVEPASDGSRPATQTPETNMALVAVLGEFSVSQDSKGPVMGVTAIAISQSGEYIATGHETGSVCLWNLKTGALVKRNSAIPVNQLADLSAQKKYGHVVGAQISQITFAGASNRRIVSVDDMGVAFYHVISLRVFSSQDTRRLFGSYDNRLNRAKLTTVFGLNTYDRLVAILTPFKFVILDTRPIRTVLRVLRADVPTPDLSKSRATGALAVVGNLLIVSWGTWFRVLRLTFVANDTLQYTIAHEGTFTAPVVGIQPVDENTVALLEATGGLSFMHLPSFTVIESAPMPPLAGRDDQLAVSHNLTDRGELNYLPSFARGALSGTLMGLGTDGELLLGTLVPATERLLALAIAGDVPRMVHFALSWVQSVHDGQPSENDAVSPPAYLTRPSRPPLSRAFATDLVCGAALQSLRVSKDPRTDVPQLVSLLTAVPDADSFLFGQFADAALHELGGATRVAFLTAIGHLLRGGGTGAGASAADAQLRVTPAIVAQVLDDLAACGDRAGYLSVLCVVNPARVDMDAAVRACRDMDSEWGIAYLYAVMGQPVTGLEAISIENAVSFVMDAMQFTPPSILPRPAPVLLNDSGDAAPSSHPLIQARLALATWLVEHLDALLLESPAVEPTWPDMLTQAIRLCAAAVPAIRAPLAEMLVDVIISADYKSQSPTDDGDGAVANSLTHRHLARAAFAAAARVDLAMRYPSQIILASTECLALLNRLVNDWVVESPLPRAALAATTPLTGATSLSTKDTTKSSSAGSIMSTSTGQPIGCWPPRHLVEPAVLHLVTSFALGQEQLAAFVASFEERGWWSICEHFARAEDDTARVIHCLVLDPLPNRRERLFTALSQELAPLPAAMAVSMYSSDDHDGSDSSSGGVAALAAVVPPHWDAESVRAIVRELLALLPLLCAIDVDATVQLVATTAPKLVASAHTSLRGSPAQPLFRVALIELPPRLVDWDACGGELFLECMGDLAAQDRDDPTDSLVLAVLDRLPLALVMAHVESLLALFRRLRRPLAASAVLSACNRPAEALRELLDAAAMERRPESIASQMLLSRAVELCRRVGSEVLWVELVKTLIAHPVSTGPNRSLTVARGSRSKKVDGAASEQLVHPLLYEALAAMHNIPQVLIQYLGSSSSSSSNNKAVAAQLSSSHFSPTTTATATARGFVAALISHHAHSRLCQTVVGMVEEERTDAARDLLVARRPGFVVSAATAHSVACAVCGSFMRGSETGAMPMAAWACGHVAHAACVHHGGWSATAAACATCSVATRQAAHDREVIGKRAKGIRRIGSSFSASVSSSRGGSRRPTSTTGPVALTGSSLTAAGGDGAQFQRPVVSDWHDLLDTMLDRLEREEDEGEEEERP
ncbi:hypothetical protein BC828DRAFT_414701, partial [Blastocladiella britannica]